MRGTFALEIRQRHGLECQIGDRLFFNKLYNFIVSQWKDAIQHGAHTDKFISALDDEGCCPTHFEGVI
jgi:hypothetical protein